MDGWLKGLIACACVVVIAGGAYMAYDINQRRLQRLAAAEEETIRGGCRQALLDKGMREMRLVCRDEGYITDDEFYRAGL
ncbi:MULTISPECIES: hypothetical protein [Rhizobium]|nr:MULTISPECIES: hypothetical protein [Rhizobium]MBX4906169.1 hypothetical protein [Rhizobium bangladeshense]MBX5017503.1 hypothetical protein [Rhizobium lentis]MBX5063444.1 hypothetical protein [Rhizobium lentis]MBX5075550.1 hypothetical protein [Rhizobium lentis]MBX5239342.1 hypothetical protein [Rhizobium sp. NLR22b]